MADGRAAGAAMRGAEADAPVVVVGGGLAGLTAALDLVEAGLPTTLIERRPFVGGKTFSFHDPETGVELDNGQHILLRCCTAYRALIDRLGLRDAIWMQARLRVPVVDPETGRMSAIEAGGLPPPLHLAASVLRFTPLSWGERLAAGRAVWAMLRMGDDGRRHLDDVSFGAWLRTHGQSARAIETFWDLIVLPTCNDRSDAVSARQAIMVFQVGLLRDARAAEIGIATRGLSAVADAALAAFVERGGEARLGARVRGLDHDGERVTGVVVGGEERAPARAVVLALPPAQAYAVLPEAWRGRFGAMRELESTPIVNVHLHWDREVLRERFVAVLDPALQYVFNRTAIEGRPGPDQWLTVSLSGAHTEMAMPQEQVARRTIAAVRRVFPRAEEASVLHWRVVKEREATFRPRPGSARWRLGAPTSVANLALAGAWTDTEWPATMESAVRSGHAAARVVQSLAPATAAADAGVYLPPNDQHPPPKRHERTHHGSALRQDTR